MLSIRESLQIQRLKVKGWKKILHAKRNRKRAGLGILISNKIEFMSKEVIRDKEKNIYINERFNTARHKNYKHLQI